MKTFFLTLCSILGIIASSIEIMNYLERTTAPPVAVVSNPPAAPVSAQPTQQPAATTPTAPTTPAAPAAVASVANRPALPQPPLPRLPQPVKTMVDHLPVPKMDSPIFQPFASAPSTAHSTERRPHSRNPNTPGAISDRDFNDSGKDGW